jgi:hypothetical protein
VLAGEGSRQEHRTRSLNYKLICKKGILKSAPIAWFYGAKLPGGRFVYILRGKVFLYFMLIHESPVTGGICFLRVHLPFFVKSGVLSVYLLRDKLNEVRLYLFEGEDLLINNAEEIIRYYFTSIFEIEG